MVLMGNTTANTEFVDKFIKLGCDYTLKDSDGDTALHWAAYHNNVGLAEVPDLLFLAIFSLGSVQMREGEKGSRALHCPQQEETDSFRPCQIRAPRGICELAETNFGVFLFRLL